MGYKNKKKQKIIYGGFFLLPLFSMQIFYMGNKHIAAGNTPAPEPAPYPPTPSPPTPVIHIAGKNKLFFYIYAVIVKQKFYKRPTNYY